MLLIGELINTSRKAILAAVKVQDSKYIAEIVKKQDEADADYIDVNCGSIIGKEVETMEWLIKVV